MDKESCFEIIREHLEAKQFIIDNKREISYGIQFEIIHELERGIFRIYEGKKGIRLDSSQIRHAGLRESIERIIKSTMAGKSNIIGATDVGLGNDRINKPLMAAKEAESVINVVQDPKQIIGIDESGKGDYFGPLVIAGVYTDEKTGPQLKHAGVADSKKITDNRIRELAMFIKDTCPYDIVVIENERYNDLYSAIKNLNRLLAWGHARVIENLLERVHCEHALSDQFGRPELIQKAL
ncbi:MAG TPA: ribonuclease HIII, partial [Clostridia bacterium]|nr:ribonuclease HIII [Clostridia bacterium]